MQNSESVFGGNAHSITLHGLLISLSPGHGLPLYSGVGFVHSRVAVWVPSLQVTEHSDQSVHSVQPPSSD